MMSIRDRWNQTALIVLPIGLNALMRRLLRNMYWLGFKSGMALVAETMVECDGDMGLVRKKLAPLIAEMVPGDAQLEIDDGGDS